MRNAADSTDESTRGTYSVKLSGRGCSHAGDLCAYNRASQSIHARADHHASKTHAVARSRGPVAASAQTEYRGAVKSVSAVVASRPSFRRNGLVVSVKKKYVVFQQHATQHCGNQG